MQSVFYFTYNSEYRAHFLHYFFSFFQFINFSLYYPSYSNLKLPIHMQSLVYFTYSHLYPHTHTHTHAQTHIHKSSHPPTHVLSHLELFSAPFSFPEPYIARPAPNYHKGHDQIKSWRLVDSLVVLAGQGGQAVLVEEYSVWGKGGY